MITRDPAVDPLHHVIPVQEKIKRDDRRDHEKRQDRQQRLPPAPDGLCQFADKRSALPDQIRHRGLQIFRREAGKGCQVGRKVLLQQDLEPAHQIGKVLKKRGQLIAEHRHQQNEKQHENQDERKQDRQGRPEAVHAEPLEAITDRIKQIGNGHSGDERQKHAGEDVKKNAENDQGKQPELNLTAQSHKCSSGQ